MRLRRRLGSVLGGVRRSVDVHVVEMKIYNGEIQMANYIEWEKNERMGEE